MENTSKLDRAFTILKALLTAGGPVAVVLSVFFGFGSEDANKIVTALGSISSFIGLLLFVGPVVLTPNQMTGLAKGLLTGGGAVSVLLIELFHLDSATTSRYLEMASGLVTIVGMVWTIVGSRDSTILKQAAKVDGVEMVQINPNTHNQAALAVAVSKSQDAQKIELAPILEPPPVSVEEFKPPAREYREL